MITINEEQLKLEIAHIFDSGANEMRVLEMVKNYINTRNQVSKNESIGHVMIIPTANEIQNEAERYRGVSVNKMAVETTAFAQGALWIKSLVEVESSESQ